MKIIVCTILLLVSINTFAVQSVNKGDVVKVITPNNRARLCNKPNCDLKEHLARIKTNTKLKVIDVRDMSSSVIKLYWFKVNYGKKAGWVSIYDTDKQ